MKGNDRDPSSSRVLGLPGEDFAAYSWGVTEDWKCRCHVRPQFAPPVDNCHPFLEQGFTSDSVHVCMGDGSVQTFSSSISDQAWYYATTPNGGEVSPDPQVP